MRARAFGGQDSASQGMGRGEGSAAERRLGQKVRLGEHAGACL